MPRTTEQIIAKAGAEQQQGRAWRAKEILRGAMASGRVEPAILEAYGRLLDTLGDRVEAGKYLFASGVRGLGDADAEPIALFKRRYGKGGHKHLIGQLPTGVRRLEFAQLPEAVQKELRETGLASSWPRGTVSAERREVGGIVGAVAAAVGLLCLMALLVGFWTMASWVWSAVVGE